MNYSEIEGLKYLLTRLLKDGCRVKIAGFGINGRIIGVGFRPYWTNPIDTKIDRLELNIVDDFGRVIPATFNYITGYEILDKDSERVEDSRNISLEVVVYSPEKRKDGKTEEKIKLEFYQDS